MENIKNSFFIRIVSTAFIVFIVFSFCSEKDNGLAPYVGSPQLSGITIQDSTFNPKITWLGGYVSVLGVNLGNKAALDSSLVFLVYRSGNDLHYPVTVGQVPTGAQDLTSQYGGTRVDSLIEDSTYTYWILKEREWNQISSMSGKILVFDSTLTSSIQVSGDSIKLSGESYSQVVKPINVYINISDLRQRGRLGSITVEATNTSNDPIIRFTITQVTDTLISAIGIVQAGQFDPNAEVWTVLSISDSAGITLYGKKNVISSPVVAGQTFPETQVFVEYPEGGLKHNATYYVWIANKHWDGEGRILSTNYYAYVTFNTR